MPCFFSRNLSFLSLFLCCSLEIFSLYVCLLGPCDGSLFTCGNNKCVAMSLVCNGVNDCGDFTDELRCTSRELCALQTRKM